MALEPAPAVPAGPTSCFCLFLTLPRKGEGMGVCLPLSGHSGVPDAARWSRMGSRVQQNWARFLRSAAEAVNQEPGLVWTRAVAGPGGQRPLLPPFYRARLWAKCRPSERRQWLWPSGQSAHLPMAAPGQRRANTSSPASWVAFVPADPTLGMRAGALGTLHVCAQDVSVPFTSSTHSRP